MQSSTPYIKLLDYIITGNLDIYQNTSSRYTVLDKQFYYLLIPPVELEKMHIYISSRAHRACLLRDKTFNEP